MASSEGLWRWSCNNVTVDDGVPKLMQPMRVLEPPKQKARKGTIPRNVVKKTFGWLTVGWQNWFII